MLHLAHGISEDITALFDKERTAKISYLDF